jgi:hypothetical protein
MKKQTIHEVTDLDYPVKLEQTGLDRFTVTYGLQVRAGLDYAEAAKEYGKCILHSATCAGRIKN